MSLPSDPPVRPTSSSLAAAGPFARANKLDRPSAFSKRPALELYQVTKLLGTFKAVDDLSFSLPAGSICGFLGPNGADKTTTIRMILDIFKPASGRLGALGHPSALEARHRLGYLPEEKGLYRKMKTWAVIAYFATLALGSVCNTLKEAQSYLSSLTLVMIIPLMTMTFIPRDPNGALARVLSWIPCYPPFTMTNRAMASPPLAALVGTFILLLVCTAGALWMAGKVCRIGILRTGQPPKIVELLRWALNR